MQLSPPPSQVNMSRGHFNPPSHRVEKVGSTQVKKLSKRCLDSGSDHMFCEYSLIYWYFPSSACSIVLECLIVQKHWVCIVPHLVEIHSFFRQHAASIYGFVRFVSFVSSVSVSKKNLKCNISLTEAQIFMKFETYVATLGSILDSHSENLASSSLQDGATEWHYSLTGTTHPPTHC